MTVPRVFLPATRRYAAALDRVRRATPRERLMLARTSPSSAHSSWFQSVSDF